MCARATKTKSKQNEFTTTLKWLFMIGFFLLNCLLIDFFGCFSSFNICQLNKKDTHKIQQLSILPHIVDFLEVPANLVWLENWQLRNFVCTQWPRCSTNERKKQSEWCKNTGKNGIVGGCKQTDTSSRFMHTKVTRSKCENIYNCIFMLNIFTNFFSHWVHISTMHISHCAWIQVRAFNAG